jgi:hypothetical protein
VDCHEAASRSRAAVRVMSLVSALRDLGVHCWLVPAQRYASVGYQSMAVRVEITFAFG